MALKAGRVGVAPSQVKPDGTLNIVIPDPPEPPEPTPATKLYKKSYTLDKSKMTSTTMVANLMIQYQTNPATYSIAITGYTPIAVKIIDKLSGYNMGGACIIDPNNSGAYAISFYSKYQGSSSDFALADVYYVKNDDLVTLE